MYRSVITIQVRDLLARLRTLLERSDLDLSDKEVSTTRARTGSSKGEEQMLSMILSDALNGVDIPSKYPAFVSQLQRDADLRAYFLEALDVLELSALEKLEGLPLPANRDLSFLNAELADHTIKQVRSSRRQVSWTQPVAYLQKLFFSPDLLTDTVFRSGMDYLEAPTFNLFRGEAKLDDTAVSALLEARQPLEEPEVLMLSLQVALQGDVEETARLSHLRAHLRWADYSAVAQVDEKGQASFPKLPLEAVIEEANERIRSNLQLTIEGL